MFMCFVNQTMHACVFQEKNVGKYCNIVCICFPCYYKQDMGLCCGVCSFVSLIVVYIKPLILFSVLSRPCWPSG